MASLVDGAVCSPLWTGSPTWRIVSSLHLLYVIPTASTFIMRFFMLCKCILGSNLPINNIIPIFISIVWHVHETVFSSNRSDIHQVSWPFCLVFCSIPPICTVCSVEYGPCDTCFRLLAVLVLLFSLISSFWP